MSVVVKPFPVLYACQGCPEFGQIARDVGALLEQRGLVEMVWLGATAGGALESKAKSRFPIFALDGCASACARRWLARQGVEPARHYDLTRFGVKSGSERDFDAAQAEDIVQRLIADLRPPVG